MIMDNPMKHQAVVDDVDRLCNTIVDLYCGDLQPHRDDISDLVFDAVETALEKLPLYDEEEFCERVVEQRGWDRAEEMRLEGGLR